MKRIFRVTLITILSITLTIALLFSVLFVISLFKIDKDITGYDWTETTPFSLTEHTTTVYFEDEINILFLTDTHYFGILDNFTADHIKRLVHQTNPDLIILVGDNTFTPFNGEALAALIDLMDSFSSPWTLVFGNHDDFGRHTKNYMADQLLNSVYSIFTYGPNDFGGSGNQIINLVSNDNIIHSLILLDTVTDGNISPPITEKQIAWYEWAVNGLSSYTPNIKTSIITHVALPEMADALIHGQILAGFQGENVSIMPNFGLYDKIKTLHSTKYLIHGHDHLNNTITLYEDIYFVYVMQVGFLTYGHSQKGGTLFKLDKFGAIEITLVYA